MEFRKHRPLSAFAREDSANDGPTRSPRYGTLEHRVRALEHRVRALEHGFQEGEHRFQEGYRLAQTKPSPTQIKQNNAAGTRLGKRLWDEKDVLEKLLAQLADANQEEENGEVERAQLMLRDIIFQCKLIATQRNRAGGPGDGFLEKIHALR